MAPSSLSQSARALALRGPTPRGDVLWLNPCLPDELCCITMVIRYRGHALDLTITHPSVRVHAHESNAAPINLGVVDKCHTLQAGDTREFSI